RLLPIGLCCASPVLSCCCQTDKHPLGKSILIPTKMPRKLIYELIKKHPEIGEHFLEQDKDDNFILGLSYREYKAFLSDFPSLERFNAWTVVEDWMGTCDTPPLALSPNQSPHSTIQQNLQTIHVPLETQSFQLPRLTSQQPICVSPKTQSTQSPCPREESSIRREESSIQREESSIRREESSIRREESSIRREGSSIRREEQMCPPSILKSDGGKILLSSFSWIEKAAACHQPDILVISSPRFVVYKDAKLMNTEKAGGLNKTQVDQLLRTTITNMQTELSLRKYPRTPSDEELEEMAKALTITYPSLIDELNSHEDCLSKLTRRVYNDPNCRAVSEAAGERKRQKRKNKITTEQHP
uniref:Uncharacterized protein n=1 Tax=Clytia hemisphaerica TaxID=252671 RepID=A0A7M5U1F6_9CNID